jgi:hypothetical protein
MAVENRVEIIAPNKIRGRNRDAVFQLDPGAGLEWLGEVPAGLFTAGLSDVEDIALGCLPLMIRSEENCLLGKAPKALRRPLRPNIVIFPNGRRLTTGNESQGICRKRREKKKVR